jgi:hypothetical protein
VERKRVVVLGTGTIGRPGLKAVIEHPELELVGLHVWSADKVGRDAGEIAGTPPTGVKGTNDLAALLDLKADCLAHFGNGAMREEGCNAEIIPFLERGTNVVTCSMMDVVHPRHGRAEYVEPLRRACERGNVSIFSSGVDPGFFTTNYMFALLSIAGRIDQVGFSEIADISEYAGVESLKLYGFNEPLDYRPAMFTDGVGLAWHESSVRNIADYLGAALHDVTSTWETAALDHDFTATFGTIEAGKTVAVRWTITGFHGGRPLIVYRKIERLSMAAAPEWEQPSPGSGAACWRIQVEGDPGFTSEISGGLMDGCAMTALHPVNAIPTVCDAPAGILDPLTIAPFYSRNIGT